MTKQMMNEFLKESGVSEEGIARFEEIYEKSVKAEASTRYVQENEADLRGQAHIAAMAAKHNIRNR